MPFDRTVKYSLLAAVGVACGDAPPLTVETTVRDSSGIQIVATPVTADQLPVFATVSPETILMLGTLDGDSTQQFGSVGGAVRLSDGGIAVAETQADEIRLFNSDGSYRTTFGRKGDGPGEFQSLTTMAVVPGDSIWAFDSRHRRVTVFDQTGDHVSVTINTESRLMRASRLPNGGILGTALSLRFNGEPEAKLVRDTIIFERFGSDGILQDTLATLADRDRVQQVSTNGQMFSIMQWSPRYHHRAVHGAVANGFVVGTSDRFELQFLDADGRVTHIARAPGLEQSAESAGTDAYIAQDIAAAETPENRTQRRDYYAIFEPPDPLPAYGALVPDGESRVWVSEFGLRPGETDTWYVFDTDARLLGSVTTAPDLTLFEVGPDYLIGMVRDELDVPFVVMYGLTRTDASGDASSVPMGGQ